MDILSLIVSLVSGIVGGNIAGSALGEDKNLGVIGNSLTGLLGGGAGNWILQALGVLASAGIGTAAASSGQSLDFGALLANIGGSGVAGAVLTALVTFIKAAIEKKA